jgi:molecular chaperone GrpE (heat shock protein)
MRNAILGGGMTPRFLQSISITVAAAIAASGSAMVITGCEGLDYSAGAEGTGVQVVSALVVLAKYKANGRQKAAAEASARAISAAALKPVYEKRRAKVREESQQKIAATEREYARKIDAARIAPPNTAPPTLRLQQEKQAAVAKIQAEEVERIAVRPIPSIDELKSALPQFIAVPVPPQNVSEEQGGKGTYMLYDTHRQQLATDDVYVLNREPRDRSTVKIDGLSARIAKNP